MESIYPASPTAVPADLTNPTPAYRRHAWLAMAGLGLFVALYFLLAGWFTWTAYHLLRGALESGGTLVGWGVGLGSALLAVFMWKALFYVRHRHEIDDIEVTAEDQPRLFEFLNRLADEAGAPRAHRVFLSPRVNAAVFYDLSILNLIFPSKKNLEIGLALVNSLTLGEMKAVLAHEFGHFAQKSMAVGRWVYIAQQIAAQIIARRDALDALLRGLSRFDIRIAWVGWILSLIVWSIRSLMETVFRLVVLADRALGREMELQADLVSVSLTGSDALVHALYRLHGADDAWERTMSFASGEAQAGRPVRDLFEIQSCVTQRLREVLCDPTYGEIQPVPTERPSEHRVFKAQLAQPPRMWATHPANTEREQNAKRVYIRADIDCRSAWALFDDVQGIKERMSAHVFRKCKAEPVALEDSIKRLQDLYNRAYLNPIYRGTYLGRALARHAEDVSGLYNPPLKPDLIKAELASLYPEALAGDLERLRDLESEHGQLKALKEGYLKTHDGVIRYRGRTLKRKDLAQAIEQVEEELDAARSAVIAHDRRCRTAHLAAAASLGNGWDAYLRGLAKVVHFAEHNQANLQDAQGLLANVYSVVTADGRVSQRERRRLTLACLEVHVALRHIYEDEGSKIVLDRTLLRRLEIEDWKKSLGDFHLPVPTDGNLGDWLDAIDSWIGAAAGALGALRAAALEQLLLAETQVARFVQQGMQPAAAPAPTQVPDSYPRLMLGAERPRQKKLDLWDRFYAADGLVPTIARLAVACGIVGATLTVAGSVADSTLHIYNGLARPVLVEVGGESVRLSPFANGTVTVPQGDEFTIVAQTLDHELIETFDANIERSFVHYVYNVAGASPLVEWTATYGDAAEVSDRRLGAPRWTTTKAALVFEQPPEQISSSSDGGRRRVLSGLSGSDPAAWLELVNGEQERRRMIETHARWDDSQSQAVAVWLAMAAGFDTFSDILRERLQRDPTDVLTLRVEQDTATHEERPTVCARHRSLVGNTPTNANLQYVAARCIENEQERDRAFLDLYREHPENGWIAQAAGYTFAEQAKWQDALAALERARSRQLPYRERITMDLGRIRRLLAGDERLPFGELTRTAPALQTIGMIENGVGLRGDLHVAYGHLARGELDRAAALARTQPEWGGRVLWLAAASDHAPVELVREVLRAKTADLDFHAAWSALALARRERADIEPFVSMLVTYGEAKDIERVLRFLREAEQGVSAKALENHLMGLPLELRAHAYSAGSIVLGQRAPAEWRQRASQLLFVTERPWFALSPSVSSPHRVPPRRVQ